MGPPERNEKTGTPRAALGLKTASGFELWFLRAERIEVV